LTSATKLIRHCLSELIVMRIIKKAYYNWRRRILSRVVKNWINLSDISIISMNCIGGVLYHDCRMQFLSPTINLFFTATDFIKFVNCLEYYLSLTPIVTMGDDYPIGRLDDIHVYFMHFDSVENALKKWEERKKRVKFDRIFVIMVEQNGFSESEYAGFLKIKYPKLLFAKDPKYNSDDVVCFEKYKDLTELPNIIENREFYKTMKLPKAIQRAYR